MRIIVCHLLNDYSGSPKVLSQLVKGWIKNKHEITIITCAGREGFLSNINGAKYQYNWYKWSKNQWMRLLFYTWSQFLLFFKILVLATKKDIVYVNTILPFGAALAGKIKACKVIYHVHEISVKPKILKSFLFKILNYSANKALFVSNYVAAQTPVKIGNKQILYNAIENDFISTANRHSKQMPTYKNVLMLSSLKTYKGIFELVKLATINAHYNFKLVANASQHDIDSFFHNTAIPKNLIIYSTQSNTHPFYAWADIVLNLSKPLEWIETFGLTAIEAMAYHLPVIAPPIGGIAELVKDGENGYLVDSTQIDNLNSKLNKILSNPELYLRMANKASDEIKKYNEDVFINKSLSFLLQ